MHGLSRTVGQNGILEDALIASERGEAHALRVRARRDAHLNIAIARRTFERRPAAEPRLPASIFEIRTCGRRIALRVRSGWHEQYGRRSGDPNTHRDACLLRHKRLLRSENDGDAGRTPEPREIDPVKTNKIRTELRMSPRI